MLIRLGLAFLFFFSGFLIVDIVKGNGIELIDIIGSAVIFTIVGVAVMYLFCSSKKKLRPNTINIIHCTL